MRLAKAKNVTSVICWSSQQSFGVGSRHISQMREWSSREVKQLLRVTGKWPSQWPGSSDSKSALLLDARPQTRKLAPLPANGPAEVTWPAGFVLHSPLLVP